jgi:hypothetical protein
MDFLSDNTSRETRIGSNLMCFRLPNTQQAQGIGLRNMSTVREQTLEMTYDS